MTPVLNVFAFSTRLLAFGNREWTCPHTIDRMLRKFKAPGLLIHGAARGADSVAAAVGESLGWTLLPFPADWSEYQRTNGRSGSDAGTIRNTRMLMDGHPTIGLGFGLLRRPDPKRPGKTKATGTADMVAQLADAGVQCTIIGRADGWSA
jgi:hypothetical protein